MFSFLATEICILALWKILDRALLKVYVYLSLYTFNNRKCASWLSGIRELANSTVKD